MAALAKVSPTAILNEEKTLGTRLGRIGIHHEVRSEIRIARTLFVPFQRLSGKRGVRSAECGVRSAECGVWKMRSVENAESRKCGV